MFYKKLTYCSLITCMLGVISQDVAAQKSKLNEMQHINEVVVVAKTYKEVIPAQHLTGKQLEKLNSHSVADALRYFAGVQIKDYGGMGGLKTVNVRNMGSHHVGVFYDGIQIGNAQNGVVDLGKFSLDDLEEISLYNGQKSDIFQSAKDFASGAAIYLQPRKPVFEQGKRTNLLVRCKLGSIQLYNPSVRWERRIGDSTSLSVSGEYVKSDGKYRFRYRRVFIDGKVAYDTMATRKNSDIEAIRLETGLHGTFKGGSWQAKVYFYNSDRGLPGAIVKNVFYNGERQGDRNFFVQSSFIKDITSNYKIQVKAKYAYDYTHYLSRDTVLFMKDTVTRKMQFDNTYRQHDSYVSVINMYSINSNWNISFATDGQINKLCAVMRGVGTPFAYPQRYTGLASLATSLIWDRVKVQASLLGTFVTERVKNTKKAPDKRELSPAVFLGYTPLNDKGFSIRAFYKRIFRMPTFNDLYYAQIGYSDLKPEYINQVNLGATYCKKINSGIVKEFALQVDAYHAIITDKIIAAPTGSSFRWMMTNMGRVKNRGVEACASVNTQVRDICFNTNLTYSYTKAQDYTKINGAKMSSYGDQIPYTPWHSGSAIFNLAYKTYALNYSIIYVGERYDGAVNNIARNYVEPWYTHDISLQKEFRLNKASLLKMSLEINNTFNQYYDIVLNYPMPGRNYRLSLSMNL